MATVEDILIWNAIETAQGIKRKPSIKHLRNYVPPTADADLYFFVHLGYYPFFDEKNPSEKVKSIRDKGLAKTLNLFKGFREEGKNVLLLLPNTFSPARTDKEFYVDFINRITGNLPNFGYLVSERIDDGVIVASDLELLMNLVRSHRIERIILPGSYAGDCHKTAYQHLQRLSVKIEMPADFCFRGPADIASGKNIQRILNKY
ncbi:hypothetical protein JXA85_00155 [Candidatus Woesearchaeota archaeon]|nr:hypothetical protein [Candidatus Woesearchaeota archaeon]